MECFVVTCAVGLPSAQALLPPLLASCERPRLKFVWSSREEARRSVSFEARLEGIWRDTPFAMRLFALPHTSEPLSGIRASLTTGPGLVIGLLHENAVPAVIATLRGGARGQPLLATGRNSARLLPAVMPQDLAGGDKDVLALLRRLAGDDGVRTRALESGQAALSLQSETLAALIPEIETVCGAVRFFIGAPGQS